VDVIIELVRRLSKGHWLIHKRWVVQRMSGFGFQLVSGYRVAIKAGVV